MIRPVLVAAAALCLPLLGPAPAYADHPAADTAWTVVPASSDGAPTARPYLVYTLAPGQAVDDQVLVENTGGGRVRLRVYPTDGYTGTDGQLALLTRDQPSTDVGTWITPDSERVAIDAAGRSVVRLRLRVPEDAEPGDHVGGVVTSVARPASSPAGDPVLVDVRVAVRVYVRVSGRATAELDADHLVVRRDAGSPWNPFDDAVRITYRARNTGGTRLAVTGGSQVSGPLGLSLGEVSAQPPRELLPGGDLESDAQQVERVLPLGRLTVLTTVRAVDPVTGEELAPLRVRTSLTVVPWAPLGLLLGLGGVLLGLRILLRRRSS